MPLAIHGHFYQPERIDPFTNTIPHDAYVMAMTKHKFHNWNELINAQCYSPNAKLDNFSLITFDVVRPLAQWLMMHDTDTYHRILLSAKTAFDRDKTPNVFASSWDHAILPFLNDVDLQLEISWGLADFYRRFGFNAEYFWLPETAVSNRVLAMLANKGIRMVILSPHQAASHVSPHMFYRVRLPESKFIDVSFFHKEFSDRLSFDNTGMANADTFTQSIVPYHQPPFLLGTTDGERYGHHLEGGPQFLHHLLTQSAPKAKMEPKTLTRMYLETTSFPETAIVDMSSWSCICGGLVRWQGDCNCCLDYNDHNNRVNGGWKVHLMQAVRELSSSLWDYSNRFFSRTLKHPLAACEDFVHVLQHQMTESEFLAKYALAPLDDKDTRALFLLMDMQQYRLASFTSCATFFWNVDRPEPRIVIQHAKKALSTLGMIHETTLMYKLEAQFVETLAKAVDYKSGLTGKDLYEEHGHLYFE